MMDFPVKNGQLYSKQARIKIFEQLTITYKTLLHLIVGVLHMF